MSFTKPIFGADFYRSKDGQDRILNHELTEGHLLEKIIDEKRTKFDDNKGVLIYHKTFPYPEKGMRDPSSVNSSQLTKRALLTQLQFFTSKVLLPFHLIFLLFPWKLKIKLIEAWANSFFNFTSLDFDNFIPENKYYSPLPKEIYKAIELFLSLLGFKVETANHLGSIMGAFIQYDTAYWTRLEDILSETTKERLLKNFVRETDRLLHLLAERDPERPHLVKKFAIFVRILSIGLWHPKIKKALRKTIESLTFENLQYDEGDRYNIRNTMRYRFFGMGIKERNAKWPPEQHLWAKNLGDGKYELITTDGMSLPSVQRQIEEQHAKGY